MPINYYCGINLNQTSLEKPVIDPLATPPDVGTEVAGQMYFDNAGAGAGIMYFWNGTAWRSMDATAATGVTTLAIGFSSIVYWICIWSSETLFTRIVQFTNLPRLSLI